MRGLSSQIKETLLQLVSKLDEETKKDLIDLFKEAIGDKQPTKELFVAFIKHKVREEFAWFVKIFVQCTEGQSFDFALHAKILCEVCQQHSCDNLKYDNDVLVNIPPGHSKTLICNILYTAWLLGRRPSMRILVKTTSDDMAVETNNKTALILTSTAYKEVFGNIVVNLTNNDIRTFDGLSYGYRNSTPIGSRVTGRSCELLIVDDPNNVSGSGAQENASYQSVINQYEGALSTRQRGTDASLQNFVIQQRISMFDLSGHILNVAEQTEKPINHIIIKAWEEEDTTFTIQCKDYNRIFSRPAGYLWYPKSEKMLNKRLNLYERMKANPYLWSSQYQQDPSDTGLALIPMSYFNWYECEKEELPIVASFITCDIAFSGDNKNSDRTCICSWGLTTNGDLYLLDILFDRYPIEQIPQMFIEFYKKNQMYTINTKERDALGHIVKNTIFCYAFFIEKEKNETFITYLKDEIDCIKVLERKANTTKLIRLNKALPILALKVVHLPKKRFFKEMGYLAEELRSNTAETFDMVGVRNDAIDNILDAVNEGRKESFITLLERINNVS